MVEPNKGIINKLKRHVSLPKEDRNNSQLLCPLTISLNQESKTKGNYFFCKKENPSTYSTLK